MNQINQQTKNKKISRLWCLAKDLGMESDMLHVAVEGITGKTSISSLTINQLSSVIDVLNKKRRQDRQRKYRKNSAESESGVEQIATPDQRELVSKLMHVITEKLSLQNPQGYLEAICRRTFHSQYSRLRRSQMIKLIETLKSIQNRGVK